MNQLIKAAVPNAKQIYLLENLQWAITSLYFLTYIFECKQIESLKIYKTFLVIP